MKKNLSTLLLHAAILASPLLGQQTGLVPMPGGVARPRISAPRRRTASDHLALALAAERRTERECRNLRNREGFRRA